MFRAPSEEISNSGGFKAPQQDLIQNEPVQTTSLMDKAKNLIGIANEYSPMNILAKKAPEAMTGLFNAAGEKTAEFLGNKQVNPYLSGAAGTAVSMAPDFALMGMGGNATKQLANAPLAKSSAPLFNKAKDVVSSGGKKMIGALFGPSESAIEARLARPQSLKSAVPYTELSDEMAGTMKNLSKKISTEDKQAWESLLKLKAEPRSEVLNILKGVKRGIKVTGGGAIGQADKRALQTIDGLINDIQTIRQKGVKPELEQFLDQRQIREVLQAARRNINWADPSASRANEALIEFQAKLSDRLKANNPQYEQIMEPLAQKTRLLDEMEKSFSIKNVGGDYVPQNTTAEKFSQALDPKRVSTRRILSEVKKETGKDFLQKAEDYKYSQEFTPGERARGSARTNLGTAVGAGVGAMFGGWGGAALGGPIGGMAGRYVDRQGGVIAGKILDYLSKGRGNVFGESVALANKYVPILENALARGTPALAAAHNELVQTDPQYQTLVGKVITIPTAPKRLFRKAS